MGFWRVGGPGGRTSNELLLLHAGYNMKADQGPAKCLASKRLNSSELYAVHFSGREKPYHDRPNKDALWKHARLQFVTAFHMWGERLGVDGCSASEMLSVRGCHRRQ